MTRRQIAGYQVAFESQGKTGAAGYLSARRNKQVSGRSKKKKRLGRYAQKQSD